MPALVLHLGKADHDVTVNLTDGRRGLGSLFDGASFISEVGTQLVILGNSGSDRFTFNDLAVGDTHQPTYVIDNDYNYKNTPVRNTTISREKVVDVRTSLGLYAYSFLDVTNIEISNASIAMRWVIRLIVNGAARAASSRSNPGRGYAAHAQRQCRQRHLRPRCRTPSARLLE